MDWPTTILLVLIGIGVVAGVALGAYQWVTNPAKVTALAVFLFKQLMPRILRYIFARMTPELEEEKNACIDSGGTWDNWRKRCKR